jgi:hypothetical protein
MRISLTGLALLALIVVACGVARAQDNQPVAKPTLQPGVLWLVDLGVAQGYDDSPLGTGQGGYFTQFNPSLSFREDAEHGFWSLNFQPSVQRFYNFSVADRVNESASTRDKWQMSRRWTFDLIGNYLHTSDPFARSQEAAQAQPVGGSVVASPNNAFIGPESPFTVFGGSGTFHYQVRQHTELTFGGDYFSNRENTPGLPNTTGQVARAGYRKMVSRSQSIGLNYSGQFLSVVNPSESITTHTLLLSFNLEWKTGEQFVLFAGPQYSLISANLTGAPSSTPPVTAINQFILGYSAGSALSLEITKQNFFQMMASRRVVDGAGISGAVIQDEGQLDMSRRFNKRLSASVGGFYSEYEALGKLPVIVPNSWGATNRIELDLAPHSSFSAGYDYFHQPQISTALANLFSHNRAWIEYRYSFGSLAQRR